jgi:hypothetical protein
MAPALRRLATGQFEQLLLDVPLDLDLVRSWGLGPVVQGGFESLGDAALPQALDGSHTGRQNGGDLGVRVRLAVSFVGQEQNAGMGEFSRCRLARRNQLLQRRSFLPGECDAILVHCGGPFLEAYSVAKPQETVSRVTRQSKINESLVA